MPFGWTADFDSDKYGEPRIVPSGHYRFSLKLWSADGNSLMMEIHGFRANKSLTTILPPLSSSPNGRMFNIIDLSPEGMKVLLDFLRQQLKNPTLTRS